MSYHRYRQETQANETDQPPEPDSLEENYREQVHYRQENKVTVTDQTMKTDGSYEHISSMTNWGEPYMKKLRALSFEFLVTPPPKIRLYIVFLKPGV